MKIAEYNEMMAYLTRPEPEVLPEPKPQELLDIQEDNRKGRLLESLNKIGGRLEDSSLDFINRENFAQGTPAGYITRKQLAEKLGISPFTIERAKGENSRLYQKIKELMNISKEGTATKPEYYKPKKETLNSVIKEIKKFSGVAAQKLPREEYRGKKTTLSQVKDVLNKSDKPLDVKQVLNKLPDLNKATINTSLSVLKKDKNFKNKINLVSPTASALEGAQTKATKIAPIMNTLRDQFVLDPDSDVIDIAKAMVGDKKFNAANNVEKQKYLKDASRQVSKFVSQFSTGATKTTPGFKNIDPDKLGDILDSIEARTNDFGFESGTLRQLRFAIADAKRGLAERTTEKLRSRVSSKGKAVDEVVGTAATFEKAPGYIEATQVIDSEINQIKGKKLDPEFSRVFNQSLNGNFSGVNNYNKKAKAFGKKYKIDVPIIKTGSNLKPEKIISNFKDFTSSAQKNIKEIAKEKGVVVQTKSKPLQTLAEEVGQKKLSALQELASRTGAGVDPSLLMKAGFEEFVKPTGKFAGQVARGVGTAADLAISAGKGGTGLALGALLEADPIITGMSEGKDFGQTARDTFVGSAIDLIPGVNLGSLNEDLIKLADTEEQRVAVQNLIDYQKDYDRFNKDFRALKSYNQLNQVELEELGFTASDLVDMENKLTERFKDIQTRAPKVYNPEVFSLARELATKEAMKRKENLETGIAGKIFGDRMAKDPNFIENQIQQIMAASTGAEGATDSYTDNYRFLPQEQLTSDELDERFDMEGGIMAANGGRIGFADGPIDPKRRTFMKIMAGIASLPIFSKFIGKSEVAKPIVKIAGSSTKMPDWFPDLINKAMFSGTGKKIDADIMKYEVKELPGIEIYRHDDGKVFVSGKNEYGKSYEIEYEPPGYELVDETTGKTVKRPGDFIAQEEVPVNVDPDGNADFDAEILEDLDQLLGSDTRVMEEFATGKKIKGLKSGEYNVGQAEARAEQAADEAAELEVFDEID